VRLDPDWTEPGCEKDGMASGHSRLYARFADAAGDKFALGVVLHDGDAVLQFGDRLYAAPVASLF
jgi:hypothetical protein